MQPPLTDTDNYSLSPIRHPPLLPIQRPNINHQNSDLLSHNPSTNQSIHTTTTMDLLTPPSSQTYAKIEDTESDSDTVLLSRQVFDDDNNSTCCSSTQFSGDQSPTSSQISSHTKQKRKPKLRYRPNNGTILDIQSYDPEKCISEQDDEIDNEDVSFLHYAFKYSKKMTVVTGAGISVASGIPDFRSSNGLFQGLKSSTSAGSNGKALFDSSVYSDGETTAMFHAMINQLYDMTENSKPTDFHKIMDTVSSEGRLLRHYTQNIDCLEAQLPNLQPTMPIRANPPYPPTIQLHGTIKHMYCSKCRWSSEMDPHLFQGNEAPACPECEEMDEIRSLAGKRSQGIGCLRPRIVLYNELHPDGEHIGKVSHLDLKSKPDCLIIAGTSLKIPGVRRLVKELAKAVHAVNGCVIWINRDEPSMSVVDYIQYIDLIITGDCQDIPSIVDNYDRFLLQKKKKTAKRSKKVKEESTSETNTLTDAKVQKPPTIKKSKVQKSDLLIQSRLEELVTKLHEVK
ncbi:CYFA0S21e02124g1_1 [Cyberlindnera fabianii]|uniref:CYFA0S21e02124g1_1 n=1 Tax=Cyberlindnera fabianii TaxID=36022 RepID=A0A061B833_CYBFA|nr:CYFA0S21e02124g1_1 [Cyberlindnera fabianii]